MHHGCVLIIIWTCPCEIPKKMCVYITKLCSISGHDWMNTHRLISCAGGVDTASSRDCRSLCSLWHIVICQHLIWSWLQRRCCCVHTKLLERTLSFQHSWCYWGFQVIKLLFGSSWASTTMVCYRILQLTIANN